MTRYVLALIAALGVGPFASVGEGTGFDQPAGLLRSESTGSDGTGVRGGQAVLEFVEGEQGSHGGAKEGREKQTPLSAPLPVEATRLSWLPATREGALQPAQLAV